MAFAPRDTLFDSVLDFMASTPTPEQIVAYQPPEPLQQRLSELLTQNGSNGLSAAELDEFLRMSRFMSRLKLKANLKLRS